MLEDAYGYYHTGVLSGAPAKVAGGTHGYYNALTGPHTQGANFLLLDGHVKRFLPTEVSAGRNNPVSSDCGTFGTQTGGSAANSACPASTLAATFSQL